jgi:excisionase family DNA binding protein
MDKALQTLPEAAAYLSISRSSIYQMLNRGDLPTVRIGRAVRIPTSALEEWVDRRVRESQGVVPPAELEMDDGRGRASTSPSLLVR